MVYGGRISINDVITFTSTETDDVIRQISEYADYDYKQEVKLSSVVCPFQKHGSKGYQNSGYVSYELKVSF